MIILVAAVMKWKTRLIKKVHFILYLGPCHDSYILSDTVPIFTLPRKPPLPLLEALPCLCSRYRNGYRLRALQAERRRRFFRWERVRRRWRQNCIGVTKNIFLIITIMIKSRHNLIHSCRLKKLRALRHQLMDTRSIVDQCHRRRRPAGVW